MKHTDTNKVKVVIPQVGDLVKAGRTIGVITGFGQWRGGDGEPVWGLLIDGKDWGGVEWDTWAGLARTPKGNYKKKKGQNVSLHKHLELYLNNHHTDQRNHLNHQQLRKSQTVLTERIQYQQTLLDL